MLRSVQNSKSANRRKSARQGFSLIELLIVIAVILIIAAIAIPNFIRSRERANEAAAAQNLRNISTAEIVYSTTYGIGYSADLTKLSGTLLTADQNNAGLIDSVLAGGLKSGYTYTYAVVTTDPNGNVTSYTANADPQIANVSGQSHFYTDQTGVIRSNPAVSAGPTDTPI